jgi:hypothetical protein
VDAFSVAAQMLGELELGPGQLAELRAIDSKYQQRLYTLLHASEPPARPGSYFELDPAVAREPTSAELMGLRVMLVSDIRSLLSPEQRDRLDRWATRVPAAEDHVLAWEWEGGRLG